MAIELKIQKKEVKKLTIELTPEEFMEFEALVKETGLNKKELGRELLMQAIREVKIVRE